MKIGITSVVVCLALIAGLQWKSRTHVTSAGFWFEPVGYDSSEVQAPRLGGPITGDELKRIQALAWSELKIAYLGLRVSFSDTRPSMYTVRVVQTTKHHPLSPFSWSFESAGQSNVVRRFGGRGVVNFRVLANAAVMHAPPGADRAAIIDGIGRGVGRSAAHEFAHLFLATESIHRSTDTRSYEYDSADRAVQFYGPMRWDIAGPMLAKQLGSSR